MADTEKTAELSSGPDGDVALPDVAAFLKNNPGWELETATFRFTGDADSEADEYEPEDNTLITDGGTEREDEMEKLKRRRKYFTCPGCDTVADARVDAENVDQMFWKTWAEVHTSDSEDGERTEVYVHFSEDEVDRGAAVRKALGFGEDGEDITVDPDEDPSHGDDRPDLDAYHRAQSRGRRDHR